MTSLPHRKLADEEPWEPRSVEPAAARPGELFRYGTRLVVYRAVDNHVYAAVGGFLARRHKVPSRGTQRFSGTVVFEELGVLRLRRLHVGAPPTTAR